MPAQMSKRLKLKILECRADGTRQYMLAHQADVHPTVLSALINDVLPITEDDPRVIRIGAVLGLAPDECFDGGRTYLAR